jgi:beta-lactamase regulating signal transducer with metallopeptidase domain/thiol-disulfide isomerase/thioredoxin/protocatechuate 3,4-dioxygenase beta subunit
MNMNTLTERGSDFFEWLLQTSWQAAVLAALILFTRRLFRKRLSPAWRYSLWFLLVARLLLPASPEAAFSVFNLAKLANRSQRGDQAPPATWSQLSPPSPLEPMLATETLAKTPASSSLDKGSDLRPDERRTVTTNPPSTTPKPTVDWFQAAFALWLAGVAFFALRLVRSNVRFVIRIRGHRLMPYTRVVRILEECRAALRLGQRVTLIEMDEVETPAVCGLWCKRLLLPIGMCNRFSDDELRHILLHELAHLKRRDLEVHWLVEVLQVFHWFNPMLWFAFRQMRADRELATDALALSCARESERTQYGETILKVLESIARRPASSGLVGIAEGKAQIQQRLLAIARHGRAKPWNLLALGIIAALGVLALTDAKKGAPLEPARSVGDAVTAPPLDAGRDHDGPVSRNRKRFQIRVVDYDTAEPLRDAAVKFDLDFYDRASEAQEQTTGADGTASIEFETAGLKRFAYSIEKPGYLAPHGEWIKHQVALVPEQFELKASQGTEIGGRVSDEAGKPVAGAELLFDRPMNMILSASDHPVDNRKWSVRAGQRVATTDALGAWRARCIHPSVSWAALRVRHPDFADSVYSTDITKAMEAEGKDHALEFAELAQRRAEFILAPGIPVTGKVIDDTGTPRAGIDVRYADRPSQNPFWDDLMGKGSVTTDAGGRFRVAHLPKKRIFFTIQPEGYAPTVAELDLESSRPEVELRLAKGQKLTGQVLDKEDHPVSGARLTFKDWSIWQGVKWEAVSDANGRFQWDHAPKEKFQVRVEKAGFLAQDKTLQGGEDQVIRVNPVLKLSGNVVDATSKESVSRFRIFWADREDRLQQLRRFALDGSGGVYSVDVGKLHSDLWFGGYAHEFLLRIEAEGYRPATSRVFSSRNGDVGEIRHDFALEPAPLISGKVVDATGQPVAGAQVALKRPISRLRLAGKPRFENLDSTTYPVTDTEGKFRLTRDPEASHLVAVHERGVAWVEATNLTAEPIIKLQRWGRVEGTADEYDTPVTNQEIWHSSTLLNGGRPEQIEFFVLRGTTDDQARFSFDFVPPGKHRFYRMIPKSGGGSSGGPGEVVEVRAGETARVKLGGIGRPVVGRIKVKNPYVEIEWQNGFHSVHTTYPRPPENLKTREEYDSWRQREEVQRAYDSIRHHPIQFSEDGSFRIEEVVPGKYEFFIQIHDPRDPDAFAYSRYIAKFSDTFEVPDSPQRNSREPFDIGTFELSLKPQIVEGKTAAPDFTARDLGGREIKLADFKGKYVLLDFWATWCGPCIGELPYLREAHKKFGGRDDFVMIGLSLDDAIEKPREFVKKNDMPWIQAHLGEWSKTDLPGKFGVQGIPAVFLIDPEGKFIATDLQGGSLLTKLGKCLTPQPWQK